MAGLTHEQKEALAHARYLASNGIPIFVAKPSLDSDGNWDPHGGHEGMGYWLPRNWQRTKPDPAVVDRWRPGMALGMVTGGGLDLFDVDPRSGGAESLTHLERGGLVPRFYGRQASPSDGTHGFMASLGVRSLDKVMPGVDVKSGTAEGKGRGFAFLAPTVKLSKITGQPVIYRWTEPPNLELLDILGHDPSGDRLAGLVRSRGKSGKDYSGAPYDGPPYDELPEAEQRLADAHVESVVGYWTERLREAVDWDEKQTDAKVRGWELLTRDAAWALARSAVSPWTGLDPGRAEQLFLELLPDEFAATSECSGKWDARLLERAAERPVEPPWWLDFLPVQESTNPNDWPDIPARLDDSYLASWMAHKGLAGHWCFAGALGWHEWDGRHWVPRREENIRDAIRKQSESINKLALDAGATPERMRKLAGLLGLGRIASLGTLMRGVVSRDGGTFDQQPDLLNCGNGVVDLRTSKLLAHDPKYGLTRITETPYRPDAVHSDWTQTLTALDADVADWMQVRLGQAITGYTTSDDVLPIGQGGGANGKTTLLAALSAGLGGHMVYVPDKLLLANPNDHPTELMSLFGARLAVIDETPDTHLNVQRLKRTVGSETITARQVHRDNVTWQATHSLFVFTNYAPQIRETDHATWRRLLLVRFRKTFVRDDRFRARMTRGAAGRREAVLAWVVAGAQRWYDNERTIPPEPAQVTADTAEWRRGADLVLSYLTERIVFDVRACVLATDLLLDFNEWLAGHGHQTWGVQTLTGRFANQPEVMIHHVDKANPRERKGLALRYGSDEPLGRPWVWRGIRWRTAEDTDEKEGPES